MSYHHLTTFERGRIQELSSLGYSRRSIAHKLNRHPSTIGREIQRNMGSDGYIGETAQFLYLARREHSKPKGKRTNDLVDCITDKLKATGHPSKLQTQSRWVL